MLLGDIEVVEAALQVKVEQPVVGAEDVAEHREGLVGEGLDVEETVEVGLVDHEVELAISMLGYTQWGNDGWSAGLEGGGVVGPRCSGAGREELEVAVTNGLWRRADL